MEMRNEHYGRQARRSVPSGPTWRESDEDGASSKNQAVLICWPLETSGGSAAFATMDAGGQTLDRSAQQGLSPPLGRIGTELLLHLGA